MGRLKVREEISLVLLMYPQKDVAIPIYVFEMVSSRQRHCHDAGCMAVRGSLVSVKEMNMKDQRVGDILEWCRVAIIIKRKSPVNRAGRT